MDWLFELTWPWLGLMYGVPPAQPYLEGLSVISEVVLAAHAVAVPSLQTGLRSALLLLLLKGSISATEPCNQLQKTTGG